MVASSAPKKAAIELSQMLTAVFGADRFPVDVEALIYERTRNLEDPITKIRKVSLNEFEGTLVPSRKKREWHILYNQDSLYPGRERFTLAHEFCHYLLDRTPLIESTLDSRAANDLAFQCNPLDRYRWKEEETAREENADTFASYLLMPIDDFRNQVKQQTISLDLFRHVTERYGVSLTAAVLKWIEFTDLLAVMVVSRDGFALWGRASSPAYAKGVFVRPGMEIQHTAYTSRVSGTEGKLVSINPQSWHFSSRTTPTHEMAIHAKKLDQSISIILLDDNDRYDFDSEHTNDTLDHFASYSKR